MKHQHNETQELHLKAREGRVYTCGTMTIQFCFLLRRKQHTFTEQN
jgi:hypothetical protein